MSPHAKELLEEPFGQLVDRLNRVGKVRVRVIDNLILIGHYDCDTQQLTGKTSGSQNMWA
jgi:hypothetical protein